MFLPSVRLFCIALFLTLAGPFNHGYRVLSIVNPTEAVFRQFFNVSYYNQFDLYLSDSELRVMWSLALSLPSLASIFSGFTLPLVAEKLGRKKGLCISILMLTLSCFPNATAKYFGLFELFFVGGFVFSFSYGLTLGLSVLFLTEISPDQNRGFLNAMVEVMVQTGMLVGATAALPQLLGTDKHWPYLYWAELATFVPFVLLLPWLPETPKFLLAKGMKKEAAASLGFYQNQHGSSDVKEVLGQMQLEIKSQVEQLNLATVWRNAAIRKGILLALTTTFTCAFSGIMAFDFFSVFMLQQVGMSRTAASLANVGIAVGPVFSAILAACLLDKIGRRTLLISGFLMLALLNAVLLVLMVLFGRMQYTWMGYVAVFAVAGFSFVYSYGPGSIKYFLLAELVPQNARSAALGILGICNPIIYSLAGYIYFPLEGIVGPYSLIVFIAPLLVGSVILFVFLPETKNLKITEIMTKLEGAEKKEAEIVDL